MPKKSRPRAPEPVIAIVGAAGLIGAGIRDGVSAGPLAGWRVRLLETAVREGAITEFAGEPRVASVVEEDSFEDADLVLLACSPEETTVCLGYPRKAGASAIVLAAGSSPSGSPVVSMEVNPEDLEGRPPVIEAASPVALPLAALAKTLEAPCGVASIEAVVFEPASSVGREAMDELYQQTVGMLNFGSQPREIFDRQMAFNLLPVTLAAAQGGAARERAVLHQILRMLRWDEERLSLRLLLTPVFHCHAAFVRLTPARKTTVARLIEAIASDGRFDVEQAAAGRTGAAASARNAGADVVTFGSDGVRAAGSAGVDGDEPVDASTPLGWAGRDRVRIAEIVPDARGAFWIWLLFDDLTLGSAANAVKIAEALGPK